MSTDTTSTSNYEHRHSYMRRSPLELSANKISPLKLGLLGTKLCEWKRGIPLEACVYRVHVTDFVVG